MEKKNIARAIVGLVFAIFLVLSFNIEVFKIMGSDRAFTLHNLIAPVAFYFLPSFIAVLLTMVVKLQGGIAFLPLLFSLPVLASMFAFKYYEKDRRIVIVLPLLGMLLFLLHPVVGYGKSYYFLIWLIPIVISRIDGLFSRSLASTFNAHVTGSIIFLYFVDAVNPMFWNALIPVVIVERVLFASGIGISYMAFNHLQALVEKTLEKINWKSTVVENE